MPNWCENEIKVYGQKENIVDFIGKMKGKGPIYWDEYANKYDDYNADEEEKLTFNALCPVPQETLDIGFDGGYIKSKIRKLAEELGIKVPEGFGFAMEFLGFKEDVSWIKEADVYKTIPLDKYDDEKIVELLLLAENLSILDGYNWQIRNWGTKWDLSDDFELDEDKIVPFEDGEYVITTYLETAWSPPLAFFVNIAPKFPDLKFKLSYCEPGANFSGILEIEKGEITSHLEGSYGEYCGEPYDDEENEEESSEPSVVENSEDSQTEN